MLEELSYIQIKNEILIGILYLLEEQGIIKT